MKTDYIGFYRELTRCFPQIGMILPSSPALARAMARPVYEADKPISILEAGPGTGPITREILRGMGPDDRLVVCEINPRFLALLERQLQKDKYFQRHRDRVSFLEGPVQQLGSPEKMQQFDVIVSSLPFFNFEPPMVEEIMKLFDDILVKGGSLSFVEYLVTRQIGTLFSSKRHRERIKGVEAVIRRWRRLVAARGGKVDTTVALWNVPPAMAYLFDYSVLVEEAGTELRSVQGRSSH